MKEASLHRRGGTRFAVLLLAGAALCVLVSCRYGLDELFGRPVPVDERVRDASAPAPSAPAVSDVDNYVFLVTADTHFGAEADPPAAAALAAFLSARNAEFVLVAGDLVEAGLPEEYSRYATWAAALGVPVRCAVGNHDLYNEGWASFRAVAGASFYSFSVGTRSFYVLDSGNGTLGRVQLELLRAAFAVDPNRKVIVSHYPLYNGNDSQYHELTNTAERATLVDLFARSGVELLLEGHSHDMRYTRVGTMHEWVCASLAGPDGQGRCLTVTVSGGEIASVTPETF